MTKSKSLVNGIGNFKVTKKYYDQWSAQYDHTLLKWSYRAPKKCSIILNKYITFKPKNMFDLACGTGLFAQEILKIYPRILIDGADISKKILDQARQKKIFKKLSCLNFDKKILIRKKYDLISCIGALTYTKNPKKLFRNISNITQKGGYFIFTHRVDLWQNQNYSELLIDISEIWKSIFVSRPILYLPKHPDFKDNIKIKIALLKKY